MRIAHVCPYDIDRAGGVQAHVRDTASALVDAGHEVTVIAPRSSSIEALAAPAAGGPRLIRIGRTRMMDFGGTRFELSLATGPDSQDLRRLMGDASFDLVHFHTPWTPFMAAQAFFACATARVVTFHDTPPERAGGRIRRKALGMLSRAVSDTVEGVVAVSEAPLSHLRTRPGKSVSVIPPCIDLRRFQEAIAPEPEPGSPVRILFVGRLEPRKGVAVLLDAYRMLCADGLSVRLLIAGQGREEPALRRFVDRHRLTGVEFLGSFADEAAPALFAGCDIFCAPSPYGESFGIVLAEAMAAGRPIAAAGNRGYRTVLSGEAAAFLAEPGEAASLHDRLRRLIEDPALRRRLGDWGRTAALAYDCRVVAPRLVAIYAEAIASREVRKLAA